MHQLWHGESQEEKKHKILKINPCKLHVDGSIAHSGIPKETPKR